MSGIVDFLSIDKLLDVETLRMHAGFTATVLNSNLVLAADGKTLQFLTGTATGFSILLPDATALQPGHKFELINQSTQPILVKNSAGIVLFTLSQSSIGYLTLQDNSTAGGSWVYWQVLTTSTASGIINYNLTATTPFATTSATDVLITGFTLTPQAGTYAIWYNASVLHTTTPIAHFWSLYKAGVQIAESLRQQDTAHSNQVMVDSTMAVSQFNGAQSIDVRVRRNTSGTLTVNARTLILIRLGP
jgi:hypothetical protein